MCCYCSIGIHIVKVKIYVTTDGHSTVTILVVKHPYGAEEQDFITVRKLRVC
jgi:hypothetical protein